MLYGAQWIYINASFVYLSVYTRMQGTKPKHSTMNNWFQGYNLLFKEIQSWNSLLNIIGFDMRHIEIWFRLFWNDKCRKFVSLTVDE